MSIYFETLNKICEGKIVQQHNTFPINFLLHDSRETYIARETLFFALKTKKNNGHLFINELYHKGISHFVISEDINVKNYPNANFFSVKDPLIALQELAKYHRKQFNYPLIAITGSNGKTIVKEWLYTILKENFAIVRSPKSYNSQIGVPLSIWQMGAQHNLAIIEAGISENGEMQKLNQIIQPNIGIFTNLGDAHQENFKNLDEKLNEKIKLFISCEKIIFCNDQAKVAQKIKSTFPNKRLISWGTSADNDLIVKQINTTATSTFLDLVYKEKNILLELPFNNNAAIENCLNCILCALVLDFPISQLQEKVNQLQNLPMRLSMEKGNNNNILINDSYSADNQSLKIALDILQQQSLEKSIILSDLEQQDDENWLKKTAQILENQKIKQFIGIGEKWSTKGKNLNISNGFFYKTTADFLTHLQKYNFQNQAILIKGSRSFAFEKIVQQLSDKQHDTHLAINLSNLIHNYNYFKQQVSPETKIMVMVKAAAYGSGDYEIATLLAHYKADYLAVAYTDEGILLRKNGIKLPIMVMNPSKEQFYQLIQYQLEPQIYSLNLLNAWLNFRQQNQNNIGIHLKIDTGMHRLGFDESNLPHLLQILNDNKTLVIKSILSHLTASDNPSFKDFTIQQIKLFKEIAKKIETACKQICLKHILNTNGIIHYPEAQLDMVRLGIGLYGLSCGNAPIKKVHQLNSVISQIKELKKGESIGYNRSEMLKKDSRIATIAIGYADGLNRLLSHKNWEVVIQEKKAPILGTICMDMCMVDVSEINCQEGDQVIIFDTNNDIEKMAKRIHTIPYEIITSISNRVKRIFFWD